MALRRGAVTSSGTRLGMAAASGAESLQKALRWGFCEREHSFLLLPSIQDWKIKVFRRLLQNPTRLRSGRKGQGKLRPGGNMWHGGLFNLARGAFPKIPLKEVEPIRICSFSWTSLQPRQTLLLSVGILVNLRSSFGG